MGTGPTVPDRCSVRPPGANDGAAASALVVAAAGRNAYAARLLELLAQALAGADDEVRALVCERDARLLGLALYGVVAGAAGAARLFLVTADAPDEGDRTTALLLDAVTTAAAASGARFLMAEVPDDEAAPALAGRLRRHGFVEEARVADYFRDGVDLLLMRRGVGGIT